MYCWMSYFRKSFKNWVRNHSLSNLSEEEQEYLYSKRFKEHAVPDVKYVLGFMRGIRNWKFEKGFKVRR